MAGRADLELGGRSVLERVRLACDQYWNIVSSPRYLAGMVVMLGTTHDRTLSSKITAVMAAAQAKLDQRWTELFADQGIPSERISVVRHVALATLRGFALRQLQSGTRDSWRRERELLAELLNFALTGD